MPAYLTRRRLATWLVAAGLTTATIAGITAEPAYAQRRNACQDLANQASVHMTWAQFYLGQGNWFQSLGDSDSASQAFVWSQGYARLAEEDANLAIAAGC